MKQTMFVDGTEVVGVFLHAFQVPDADDIYPGKGYVAVEVAENKELLKYWNYEYKQGQFIKKDVEEAENEPIEPTETEMLIDYIIDVDYRVVLLELGLI